MDSQSPIVIEERGDVLAPFLKTAQAIAEIDHPSIEAPRLRDEATKLIVLLRHSPAIAFSDLSDFTCLHLEIAECSLENVKDWIEAANSVKSRRSVSVRFRSAIKFLKRTIRLLKKFIAYQQAYDKAQQWQTKRRQ